MNYTHTMREDGILITKVVGEFTQEMTEGYIEELYAFLDEIPPDQKLHGVIDATEIGRVSPGVRRAVVDQINDPRFGKTAVWGNNRFVKVLIDFLSKATSRNDIRYFTNFEAALNWIKEAKEA